MTRTLHVISPLAWVAEVFEEEMGTTSGSGVLDGGGVTNATAATVNACPRDLPATTAPVEGRSRAMERRNHEAGAETSWRVVGHHPWDRDGVMGLTCGNASSKGRGNGRGDTGGSGTTVPIDDRDALWIAPDLLVRCNARQRRAGLAPWRFTAPTPRWMADLPHELAGRTVLVVQVEELRQWGRFPGSLGERPWSQLCDGRVSGFNAARRDITELQRALSAAPGDSTIMVSGHLAGISEEWTVTIRHGRAVASCGYCRHLPPDSHHIVTIFDDAAVAGTTFHTGYRDKAERLAELAAATAGPISASLLVAFRTPDDPGAVLEAEPVWCSAPYPVGARMMTAVIDTIAEARIIGDASAGTTPAIDGMTAATGGTDAAIGRAYEHEFKPDPWMVRRLMERLTTRRRMTPH